ncbi:unnamed protein product [Penicillium glandicola]
MSGQSAARGGFLRTLHLGALPRRTGVTDLQNQLRRVSLAANSGQARPQVQTISSLQSLFQSNSFATASTRPKTSKSPKAKKRPLTDKQQETQKIKQRLAHIKELKATALTQKPKNQPVSAYTLAVTEKLREIKGQYADHREAWKLATQHATSLSAQDEERLQAQAKANLAANNAAYKAWVVSHTPLQIKDANNARNALSRLVDKNYAPIKDDRLPQKPKSAYVLYMSDRSNADDYYGKPGTEAFTAIAEEWSRLPQSEKDVRTSSRIDAYRIVGADHESSATTNCKSKIANDMRESMSRCMESHHGHPKSLEISRKAPFETGRKPEPEADFYRGFPSGWC